MTEEQFRIASAEADYYARIYHPLISPELRSYIGEDDLRQMGVIKASVCLPKWDAKKAKLTTFFGSCIQNYFRSVVRDSNTFGRDAALPVMIPEHDEENERYLNAFIDTKSLGAETVVVAADNIDKLLAAASDDLGAILRDYFTGDLNHYCASALKRHEEEVASLVSALQLTPTDFTAVAAS